MSRHRLVTSRQNILLCIYIKMFEYTDYVKQRQYHRTVAFIKNYILTCRYGFILVRLSSMNVKIDYFRKKYKINNILVVKTC